MYSVNITEFGSADNLTITQSDIPHVNRHEVLIDVKAAGVNRPDIYQRMGAYPAPLGVTDVLGLEVAGDIVAVGEDVTQWRVGDAACALLAGGGYAEYASAHEQLCLPIPKPLHYIEAAGIPETFFTVWRNVFDIAKLKTGETLLVHGGASGIGTTAIQLAKAFGVETIATAGSDNKCAACKRLGASVVINYKEQDFVEVIEEAMGKNAIDVILDIVGGDYIQKNIKLAAKDGRIVSIGFLQSSVANVNFMQIMLKHVTLTGSTLRNQPIRVKAAIAHALQKNVWPLLERHVITPVIYESMPFTDVIRAHTILEGNQHVGKVILTFT